LVTSTDILVVGGGPAGLATAIFAAQQGMNATVLERGVWPIDKPCGEGLMPEGARLLDVMGVSVSRSHTLEGIRYLDASAGSVECRFTNGAGLGLRRNELSRAMVARARGLGIRLYERARVRDVQNLKDGVVAGIDGKSFEAKFIVAADGLNSPMRRDAGLDRRPSRSRPPRYGFRRHYRIPPWSSFVEVHWGRGAEAYVTPVSADEVGVALLWHRAAPSYDAMLARFPALESRLRSAPIITRLKGSGPFRREASRVVQGRLALVGDAAGYLDAITGEGVALGFQSARAVVDALTSGSDLAAYEAAHRRLRRRHLVITELALLLAAYPRLRGRAIKLLSRQPWIFSRLVRTLAHGGEPRKGPQLKDPVPVATLDLS
jgi:flavin-dependent dehydrogenase